MKRTRRIEIIRYSRRVTVTQGDGTPAILADSIKLPVTDLTPNVEEVITSIPEQGDRGTGTNGVATATTTDLRLRDLLRLCR